jgi:hypothetical protein
MSGSGIEHGMASGVLGLAAGAASLGLLHGLAPGHGWAIAASYAVEKDNELFYGAVSSAILGIGHLISSIAAVLVYFLALSYSRLTEVGWMNYVAGVLLIALGIRQYVSGHGHHDRGDGHDGDHDSQDHDHDQPNDHDDYDHCRDHDHAHHPSWTDETEREPDGWIGRLRRRVPSLGDDGERYSHDHTDRETDRGLYGMVLLAFALGFAHNEEFDIIAICTGSTYCLELMVLCSLAVLLSLVGVTLLLVAGYRRYEQRVEEYSRLLPTVTAAILFLMGIGFIAGVF